MRGVVTTLLVALAVLVQVGVISRIPLPWGIAPDIVVLAVVAVALGATPAAGALAGFFAGVAVDVLPPADSELGRYALVLCLAGYVVGALDDSGRRSRIWPYLVTLGAVIGVAVGFAAVGLVLGDPRVGVATFSSVIPISVIMTMVASPLVVGPMRRMRRARTSRDPIDLSGTSWVSGGVRL